MALRNCLDDERKTRTILTFLCPLLWALLPCLLNKKNTSHFENKNKMQLTKKHLLCVSSAVVEVNSSVPPKISFCLESPELLSVTCVSHRLFVLQSLWYEEVLKSFWVSLAKTQRWRQHIQPRQTSVSGFPSLINFTISQHFGLNPAWLLHFLFVWGFWLVQQWCCWANIATCCLGMQLHIFSRGQSCFFKREMSRLSCLPCCLPSWIV